MTSIKYFKAISFVSALLFITVLVFAFQNCAKVNFAKDNSCTGSSCNNVQQNITKTLALGVLTKNMACVMCHTNVNGNISGFGTMIFRNDSHGTIIGNIYAADQKLQTWTTNNNGQFVLHPGVQDSITDPNLVAEVLPELISSNLDGSSPNYRIKAGEEHNKFNSISFQDGGGLFTLTSNDVSKRSIAKENIIVNPFLNSPIIHESEFPSLDLTQCKTTAKGTITTATGQVISGPVQGNLILVNGENLGSSVSSATAANRYNQFDSSCPASKTLTISGEIVVNGDLILSGCIKGQGSIYATGNIYVPDDIKNVNSAFPYSQVINNGVHRSEALSRTNKDMISLGAGEFIIMGILRMDVITHPEQDPIFLNNSASLTRIYNWISSANGQSIYETSFLKKPFFSVGSSGGSSGYGAVALVEANLYANKGIGITLTSSWGSNIVLNGSLITPNLSLLSTGYNKSHFAIPGGNEIVINPFNNVNFDTSQINQDFRLKHTQMGYECHRIRKF